VSKAVQSFKSEYLLDFVNIVDAADDEETLDEPTGTFDGSPYHKCLRDCRGR